jgi:peptidoglycan/xylan/chitin deacetylase (PgdA/CDA1 family)
MLTPTDSGHKVTLTFDNGPTVGVTDHVLRLLGEQGVSANFFLVGNRLRQTGPRELARRAFADGHRIGHHSATHTVLLGDAADPERAVQLEIDDVALLFEEFNGARKLYRPYAAGGIMDRRVFSRAALEYLQNHGYTCVLWNSLPRDWDDPFGWVSLALADVARQPWTVVVLHDTDTGAMTQLPRFLDELSAAGVEITVDLPDSCLPIRDGVLHQDLSHLTREPFLAKEMST